MTAGAIFSLILENGSYIAIFLFCAYGACISFKQSKNVIGADILALGLLLYGTYGLLAFTIPGFTGSYFSDFSRVGMLESATFSYFISYALRLGVILIIIGLLRIMRNAKA